MNTQTTNKVVRVLLVEDNEDDYVLTREMFMDIPHGCYEIDWVADYASALAAIERKCHDIYLFDNRLGTHSGLELLRNVTEIGVRIPVIMLTGVGIRELDEQAMQEGAADFLVKSELTSELLERSIRYATERQRLLDELSRLAKFDSLTGLANVDLFIDFLNGAIARADRGNR